MKPTQTPRNWKTRLQALGTVAAGLLAMQAQGAVVAEYANDFNAKSNALVGTASSLGFGGWSVGGIPTSVPVRGLPSAASAAAAAYVGAGFLGELGNDRLELKLVDLPAGPLFIGISFDAYLLRSWDGVGAYGGGDTFGFGFNQTPLLQKTFSNGSETQVQTYCPWAGSSTCGATYSSSGTLKDKLGFDFGLWTEESRITGLRAQSSVYSFPDPVNHWAPGYQLLPFEYTGSEITFFFFGAGLQVRERVPAGYDLQGTPLALADESWGIDNLRITMWQPDAPAEDSTPLAQVPEPGALALALAGLAVLWGGRRRAATTTTTPA